ncbi:glycosyl hydrolase family 2 [Altererythrobacter ishigakiensis]|uniref:Glycosyl hydrolase family 2 n=1 Tax=Altererythrobacter ishigakiensis TaxID=476157 RepID=A0A562UM29_9SPHN|nr:glycosyl hydrolase family 2 [Altererythrobacter ishigakiensis]
MRVLGESRFAIAATIGAALSLGSPSALSAQPTLDELREQFAQPPSDTRPWAWFHVMSGNMSREGITTDLEAMERVGIGGIVLFSVTQGISYGPVKFNSSEYHDLVAHVAAECQRLGMKFSFHNSDGWSSSGGPWVTPEQSMKRLVWREMIVDGGRLELRLPQPSTEQGFYRDVAVIAYPALKAELADKSSTPIVTSSDPTVDLDRLMDGDFLTSDSINVPEGGTGWIQFSYSQSVPIRHLRLANIPERDVQISLEMSLDGQEFLPVRDFGKTRILRDEWEIDTAFTPVDARHFRLKFNESTSIGEIELSQLARIDNTSGQSALGYVSGNELPSLSDVHTDAVVDPESVVDLTANLSTDGSLRAKLPKGRWTLLRFGYTSTGAHNVMPSPEGNGLEVDKFSSAAFQAHYDDFIGPVIARTRAVAPDALSGVMIDSYEVGGQNWTAGYERKFEQATGIDLIPWLPLYAGRFVADKSRTEAMFKRIRKFSAQLINENYYGKFAELMDDEGLESLIQPYGNGPFDEIAVGSVASVPAGEFWVRRDDLSNLNGAVSAARIFGKPIAAAEAFTATWDDNWNFSPEFGKKWGDRAWVAGVNQFFFHRFAHQANTHVMPGMTMNRWGSHFDRSQPWWEIGGAAWFQYMARGQHLLRQGHAVADIAMVVGSNSPVVCPEKNSMIDVLPKGVEFDCLDTQTLLTRSRLEDGALVLQNGARYAMIWWPHTVKPSAREMARLAAARAASVPVAMANLGEDVEGIFFAAGLQPRLSSVGDIPSFTHRRVGGTDIVFVFNDADHARQFDLCVRMDGKHSEAWNPINGNMEFLSGTVDETGCSRLKLNLAPYESRFLLFDDHLRFRDAPEATLINEVVLSIDGNWAIRFDAHDGVTTNITGSELFDWSKNDNREIRYFAGTATYQNAFTLRREDLQHREQILLDLGQVESVASVRVNGNDIGTLWTAPFAIDIRSALRPGKNSIEIKVSNLWVNRLIGDAALPDTSGYEPEDKFGYRAEDNVPDRSMPDWYIDNQSPPPGPRRSWATQYFQEADDPLIPSGLIGPVTLKRKEF